MSSLPRAEVQSSLNEPFDDQRSADVIDLQEYVQEQRPETILGSVAIGEPASDGPKSEHLHYLDWRRVEAARKDPASFATLMDEYNGLIRRIAGAYFLNGGTSEDLMQEAMFGFYKAVRDYDGVHSPFKSFMELCVRRQIITTIKTANRFKHEALNNYVSFSHTPGNHNDDGEGLTLGDALPDNGRLPEDIVVGKETLEGLIDILSSELSYLEYSAL
ncbi:MAG TPA: sigma factor, partial [Candidatus Saccharimonadales bacterium]|nr:sigma factor [Candidatus Saccharimonadales bacterium]